MNIYTWNTAAKTSTLDRCLPEEGCSVVPGDRSNENKFIKISMTSSLHGIKVYLLMTFVSRSLFAIPASPAARRINITMCLENDGYKAYWDDGCTRCPPHDTAITDKVMGNDGRHRDSAAARTVSYRQRSG